MGSGMKAQLGNGSSGDPIAQVFDSTLETYSGAVKSPVAVGCLALELYYGSCGSCIEAMGALAAEPWSGLQLLGSYRCSGIL